MQSNRLALVAPLSILLVASSINYACTNDNDDNPTPDAGVYVDGGIQYGVPPGSGYVPPAGGDDTTGDDDASPPAGDDGGTTPTDGSTNPGDSGSTPVSPTGTAFAALVLGDGTTDVYTNPVASNVASIQYFKADGTPGSKVTFTSVNPAALTVSSSNLDGQISLSANGTYLLVPGYNLSVNQDVTGGGDRVIGRLDSTGTPDITTIVSGLSGSENFRGVASPDGVTLFASGSASGVVSVQYQATTTSTSISGTPADARGLNIYGGTLYAGAGNTGAYGLYSTSATTPGTLAAVTGWSTAVSKPMTTQSAGFDSDGNGSIDVIYAVDTNLGLQKWTLTSGTWAPTETFASTVGAMGVAASVSNGTATVFVSVFGADVAHTSIWSVTDPLAATTPATPTQIVVGSATASYRGLALAPSGV